MEKILAQSLQIGGQTITGPVNKFNNLADIINAVLKIVFPLALFILFVFLLWSGFDMVRNLGNPKLVESAKLRITNAVIGIILLAVSYWLSEIVIKIFF
ncbi:hypothetical protein A2313_04205 [Candidatus Roizmanbacteria bacterium RIFOXYB2_FULL_41_10]|uniref:Uncharacterized protein n=1 Tax=Candidatus Roizmanbacteria bacterium RIFOXYA1_FULL_41_12 TaxID=1802082 RepID=A0A1F7KEY3_9BACT|nr:MAG: hypothetical protein A2209_01510 [Candidatus Roizmanbacteria bacterium RIFOXYA1_FULL_41_12]OGK68129.1 MAG: hypothetical protein A2377_04170 [Candidatus Roizmanbacteria bacterium RIFOXYB1_FULL_41_27]OGK69288.1 MAG: hypothetical protein A2313_04205 [Candidatus Roizmanbacteria bacterium RIFOXYB2_FULL_41_10]OGK71915.1 MAG: hypothetical protein A2403_03090 [Candidatus Roizmanbacteria bacterium RIFOXYC1_FULL_41_16]OGK74948.1 MAG: hypothetical protein A2459_04090 [Candidatus Roizmanbacteria ba